MTKWGTKADGSYGSFYTMPHSSNWWVFVIATIIITSSIFVVFLVVTVTVSHKNKFSSFLLCTTIKQTFPYALFTCLSSFVLRVTALVVKIFSLVAQRQTAIFGLQGRINKVVPEINIRKPVKYLLKIQNTQDGSFSDPNPVIHRGVLVTSLKS